MTYLRDWDTSAAAFRFARKRGEDEALALAEKLIRKWADSERPFAQLAVVRWVKIKAILCSLASPAPGLH